ncbi:hypothetical protein LGL55_08195 [Clostridium tagluense]|uniref:hypothetical protein n=1 Tax=Clostridium TaxID=1485 RepID=UPI0013E9545B|nr:MULTISPECIES: hypothetical protein [Clostridium]MBW9155410.1 hypothetical protein [Clostridium tagluense]MBZ9621720.1 hypothetical protein [Clostridium sp. FP2]MCB2311231.1 hypothetical protein [Clostridium tagluense]MCB2315955.1 hypothetical protein [Clostridium tagluense]MCB2320698.1 hypothetical protein [Clostridium tagluense]
MRLFGPTHEDVWKMLSADIEAEFIVKDAVFKNYEVIKKFHDWIIVLDTYNSHSRNEPVYTRVYCVFSNKHGFRFKVFGEYFNNYFLNFFDMQDIKVNYDDLSDKFVVRSNSDVAIKRFLQNKTIRELINTQSDILLEIVSEEVGQSPAKTESTISVKIPGIIKNNEVLKELFELVGESLLEIENINNEFENLQFNNFTRFDVIKNSVKNTIFESDSYTRLSKDVIDNVNKVIDNTIHHHSHLKDAGGRDLLVRKKITNKNGTNEISYTENGNKEIKK